MKSRNLKLTFALLVVAFVESCTPTSMVTHPSKSWFSQEHDWFREHRQNDSGIQYCLDEWESSTISDSLWGNIRKSYPFDRVVFFTEYALPSGIHGIGVPLSREIIRYYNLYLLVESDETSWLIYGYYGSTESSPDVRIFGWVVDTLPTVEKKELLHRLEAETTLFDSLPPSRFSIPLSHPNCFFFHSSFDTLNPILWATNNIPNSGMADQISAFLNIVDSTLVSSVE